MMWITIAGMIWINAWLVQSEQEPNRIEHYVIIGQGYGNMPTPRALQLSDVERWAVILNASDDQHAFMKAEYAQFVTRHNEFLDREAPRVLRLSAELGNQQNSPDEDKVNAEIAVQKAVQGLLNEWEKLENEYIDSLLPILSVEQAERLPILRSEASRRRSRHLPREGRWTNVELRLVWEAVACDDQADRDRMALILEDYEARITPALRRHVDQRAAASVEFSRFLQQMRAGQMSPQEFHDHNMRLRARFASSVERIAAITTESYKSAKTALSPGCANRFVELARRCAFPELYPDRNALHMLFANLTESTHLDAAQKDLAREYLHLYATEHDAMCNELESICVTWDNQGARGINGFQRQFLPEHLATPLAKRDDISRKWRAKLIEAFGESTIASHTAGDESWQLTDAAQRAFEAANPTPVRPRMLQRPPEPVSATSSN